MRSPIAALLRSHSRRMASVVAITVSCAALMFACTDARDVTSVSGPNAVRLLLTPRFHLFGSFPQVSPINRARLTVLSAVTRDTLSPTTIITLNPTDAEWHLPVDFTLPNDVISGSIVVIVELINVTNGVETIEFSGETPPIVVRPGVTTPQSTPVDLVRGPPDNLNVVSVNIAPVATRVLEGDSVQLHAVIVGSGTPQIFWTALDADHATVSANGVVRTLVAGTARIVASAGPRSDTIPLAIAQRAVSVAATPSPLSFTSIGQTVSLTGLVFDVRGAAITGESLVYIVADPSIVDQPTPGTFRALSAGSTTISAVAASTPTVRASLPVSVAPVPATIELSPTSVDLHAIGATQRVTAVVRDPGSTVILTAVVQWRSENPAIADVAADGTVTARSAGSTGIVATSQAASTRIVANVNQSTVSVAVTPTAPLLESIGAFTTLAAVARDAGGASIPGATFTWSSSAPAIATVDAIGLVTARANGTATITATGPGGIAGTTSVTVRQRVTVIVFTPNAMTLNAIGAAGHFSIDPRDAAGRSVPLTTTTFIWSSDATAVATVDQNGNVTAVGNGTANITVRAGTGASSSAAVTVRQRSETITLSPPTFALHRVGDSIRVAATATDARGTAITGLTLVWTSSNPAVATVNAQGVVTALASGTTIITAADGTVTGTMTVLVQLPLVAVSVTPNRADVSSRGDSVAFTATAIDGAGNVIDGINFTWSSGNPAVATVNAQTGVATAVNDGSADIIAVAPNNVFGKGTLFVHRTVTRIVIVPDTITLPHGQQHQLTANLFDANGFAITTAQPVTWVSLNTAIATVTSTGMVTTVSDTGSARIRASSGFGAALSTVFAHAAAVSSSVSITPGFTGLSAGNCIPFGTNTGYGFTGFMYRNIPAFHMNAGDRIAFDLGATNDVDLRRNVYFAQLDRNPAQPVLSGQDIVQQGVHALAWTQVVSEANVPLNPRGNFVIGDYELVYTAESSYDFPGGGFAVGFGSSTGAYPDNGCEQNLVGTRSDDPSGLFYGRFFGKSDLTLGTLDNPGGGNGAYIGGIRIYSASALARGFMLQPAGIQIVGPAPVIPAPTAAGPSTVPVAGGAPSANGKRRPGSDN